jgi:hypothetical protein
MVRDKASGRNIIASMMWIVLIYFIYRQQGQKCIKILLEQRQLALLLPARKENYMLHQIQKQYYCKLAVGKKNCGAVQQTSTVPPNEVVNCTSESE